MKCNNIILKTTNNTHLINLSNMRINKSFYLSGLLALALTSCKTAHQSYLQDLSTLQPITNVDHLPARTSALEEKDLQRWSHLDILRPFLGCL